MLWERQIFLEVRGSGFKQGYGWYRSRMRQAACLDRLCVPDQSYNKMKVAGLEGHLKRGEKML